MHLVVDVGGHLLLLKRLPNARQLEELSVTHGALAVELLELQDERDGMDCLVYPGEEGLSTTCRCTWSPGL
jgi:hypothetical protein